MIYTLGRMDVYESALRERESAGKRLMKAERGWEPGYPGGSVWQTAKEAQAYIDANQPRLDKYRVYGVEADWRRDTAANEDGQPWHDLIHEGAIVRLS